MTDALKPGVVKAITENAEDADNFLCILMPMQIV